MREFATPLAERQRLAALYRRKYWSDPEFRLRSNSRSRLAQGLPPRSSVDEILTKGPLWKEQA